MTKTNEIDYKTLAPGTMIWVSTCYGERLAKFLGYTPAKRWLDNYPRCDLVHYLIICDSIKEQVFFDDLYNHCAGRYPYEITRLADKLDVNQIVSQLQDIINRLTK